VTERDPLLNGHLKFGIVDRGELFAVPGFVGFAFAVISISP